MSDNTMVEGDLVRRGDVLRVLRTLAGQDADLALYGAEDNARAREYGEAAMTRACCAVAIMPAADDVIGCLLAEKPFWFDPATNFVHADDGGGRGTRWAPVPPETSAAIEMTDAARAEYWQGVAERALAKHHEYAAAVAGLELFFERPGEDSMERFERIAAVFRKETGFLRPGKDCITHEPEVRQAAYDAWVQLKLEDARRFVPSERPAPVPAKATLLCPPPAPSNRRPHPHEDTQMTGQSETKHTLGQLYFYELRDSLNDGLGYIRTDADTLEICHHGDSRRSADENRANAARIVLTWNCHDELVAALRHIAPGLHEHGGLASYTAEDAAAVHAALSRATP